MKAIIFSLLLCLGWTVQSNAQLHEGLNNSTVNILTGQEKYEVSAAIWLPPHYNPSKKYPLLIYGHGSGQAGTDLDKLYEDGLPAVLSEGFRPPEDCVIICPQRSSYGVLPEWLPGILDDAAKRFSIDPARIYLTGTSAGGMMCYGSQLNVSPALAKRIAAICVLSGATQDIHQANLRWWSVSKTPVWAIVGGEDQSYVRQNVAFINSLNQLIHGIAKISIRPGIGHGGWKEVYNASFIEDGKNFWSWLFQFRLGKDPLVTIRPPHRILMKAFDGQVYSTDVTRDYDPMPGDTLVIPTGIRSFLLRNFKGVAGKPVVIMPADQGWLGGYGPFSGNITYAQYFKVVGFHIDGAGVTNFGLVIGAQSSDFEVAQCEIRNTHSIGLCAKQNPDASYAGGSWPGFAMRNVSLHDIIVRNTGTEGFYIGYTFDVIKPLASPLISVDIYNIRIDSTGWDGLQLSNCQEVRMHDLDIRHYGLKDERGQRAGLLIGGMVTLRNLVSRVKVTDGTGAGLQIFGRGLMRLSGFTLTNVAKSWQENAVFVNDYADFGYGLPALELEFNKFHIDGSSGHALMVVNGNHSMKRGKIEQFAFQHTGSGISDDVDQLEGSGEKP